MGNLSEVIREFLAGEGGTLEELLDDLTAPLRERQGCSPADSEEAPPPALPGAASDEWSAGD